MPMVAEESLKLIRKYIIDREGTATKSEVVKFMQNEVPDMLRLSRDTTIKVIESMDNLIISKGQRRGQGHRLLIEDKKEFNRVNLELSEIDTMIDSMVLPMENLEIFEAYEPKHKEHLWVEKLRDHFVSAYVSVYCMLEILLIHISQEIQSQKDAWSLYSRIIELKIKLNQQKPIFHIEGLGLYWKKRPLIVTDPTGLKDIDKEYRKFSESQGVPIYELTSKLVSRIENFKTQFLDKKDTMIKKTQ